MAKVFPALSDGETKIRLKKKLIKVFYISLIWSCYGMVSTKGHHKVESFIKNKFVEIKSENTMLFMEHKYDFEKNDFVNYNNYLSQYKYEKGTPYFSIFVDTIDTLRYSFLIEVLLGLKKHLFITGDTGVGKTAIILNLLNKLTDSGTHTSIMMNFSAQTSSEQTQAGLEFKLERRKGKKLLSGKGGKSLALFIDDINMPEPNKFGAHPPIEFLR